MIRNGNQIRLNKAEQKRFQDETGCAEVPTTLAAFNRQLSRAAVAWEAEGTPEAKLLAHLCRIGQIDEAVATASLVVDTFIANNHPELAALLHRENLTR